MPAAKNYFTKWYYPTSVTQDFEDETHIPWDSFGNFVYLKSRDLTQTKTLRPLKHIPVLSSVAVRNKTWYLYCKFQLGKEPGKVTGLQLQIQMDRGARIVDDTVQLIKNGEVIGENQATLEITQLKTYGNSWGITWADVDPYELTSGDFGVALRFQSNFNTPHSTTPAIDFVRIRYTVEDEITNRQENKPNIGWTMHLNGDINWIFRPGKSKLESGKGPGAGKPTNSFGAENQGAGDGGAEGDAGGSPNYEPYPGFFYGSSGTYIGSTGYIGSLQGYSGSNAGYVGSGFINITMYSVIPDISRLPARGNYTYEAYFVLNTRQLFYWDGAWILVVSP